MNISHTVAESPPSSHIAVSRWEGLLGASSTTALALTVIVLASMGLRLFGLNWDDGRDLHPDELYVAKIVLIDRISLSWPPVWENLLNTEISTLNPRSADPNTGKLRDYPYGALPLLVTDTVATILGWVTGENWNAADRAYLVGRALSAILDTLTVVVVFAIGSRVFSDRVGLFAALFAGLAPMSIQLAHFFTTDSWLTFFVAVSIYYAIRAAESGAGRWFAATGLGFGLAMATKGSVFALAGLIAAAIIYDVWRRWRSGVQMPRVIAAVPRQAGLAAICALVGFGVFEPYAFARPGIFVFSLQRQAEIVSGTFDIPFTRVFVGTIPVVYQLEQFVKWGFGPVAGLLALGGVFVLGRRFWREWTAGQWILLCWLLGYGLVIAIPETKFLRYLAPLVPALAITAALALDALVGLIRHLVGPRQARAALALLVTGCGLWTVAFTSVYAAEHPRLAASRWIYANVPAGSTLSWEYWDDRLPKPLGPGLTEADYQYQFQTIDLYRDQPPADAANGLYDQLEQLDYVLTTSDRVSAAIVRSPWRYPIQIRFNDLLRSGELGFTQVAELHVTPRLGPIAIDDRSADESFINYDHPRVSIFKKTELIARQDYDLLMSWAIDRPWSPTRYGEEPTLLLDEPVGDLPVVNDARWSAGLTSNSLAALAVWIALIVMLQVVGWPVVGFLLPRFADAGWGLARLVAMMLAGYLVWLGASTRIIEFRAVWCWVAILLVAAAGWFLFRRWPCAITSSQRRSITGAEVTFWVVFGLFLLYRYLNPDGWHPIWGGEKPMEFAQLNATLRSASFPPYDPWYADGYINYYYYGLYLIAFLLKLTGIPSEIGFNIAQPFVIALLASTGYSVAATIGRDLTRRASLALPAGILGAVMLVVIGNLTSLGRLFSGNPVESGSFLDWVWAGSRAIGDGITEFPYFTALYADLHAHVVALPMTVLAIALSYGIVLASRGVLGELDNGRLTVASGRFGARLLLLMLVLGTLYPTNAWDVPVYAALAVASILMGSRGTSDWQLRVVWVGSLSLAVAGGAYLLIRPFQEHYVALFSAVELVRAPTPFTEAASHIGGLVAIALLGLVVVGLPRRFAIPWPLDQPVLILPLLIFGLLAGNATERLQSAQAAAVFAVLLVACAAVAALVVGSLAQSRIAVAWQRWLFLGAAGVIFAGVAGTLAVGQPVIAGYLIAIALGFAIWIAGLSPAERFTGLLVLAAASVGAGVEVVFVADDLIGTSAYRMNTIFKFYNQIWVLLALAGAALVTRMAFVARWLVPRARLAALFDRNPGASARNGWARAGLIIVAVLLAGSLTYPLLATGPRLAQRFQPGLGSGTLNALDWMDYGTLPVYGAGGVQTLSFADDRAAIDWLNRNVAGSPVIAEASIGPYRCNGSRFSIGTGLPTIIGWERHEQQQRYRDLLPARVDDVRTLYTSPNVQEKREILRKYNVEYLVVGEIERGYVVPNGNDCEATGSAEGIEAIESMVGTDLEVAFQQGDTIIYRVLPIGQSDENEAAGGAG